MKLKTVQNSKDIDNMNMDQFIGRLTGHRCPDCGCCLWVNLVGNIWCSQCRYKSIENEIQDFQFVPIPDVQPWINTGVIWINEPITTDFKGLRDS